MILSIFYKFSIFYNFFEFLKYSVVSYLIGKENEVNTTKFF